MWQQKSWNDTDYKSTPFSKFSIFLQSRGSIYIHVKQLLSRSRYPYNHANTLMSAIVASNLNKTSLSSGIFGSNNSKIKIFKQSLLSAFHTDLWPSHSERWNYWVAQTHYSVLNNALQAGMYAAFARYSVVGTTKPSANYLNQMGTCVSAPSVSLIEKEIAYNSTKYFVRRQRSGKPCANDQSLFKKKKVRNHASRWVLFLRMYAFNLWLVILFHSLAPWACAKLMFL